MDPRARERHRPRSGARGQLSFDFLIGMSVFLIAIGFVFGLAHGAFEPFATDSGENMIAAERGAARLVEDALVVSPDRPGVLDRQCAVELFNGDSSVPSDCRYTTEDLNDALGIKDTMGVNVTVEDGGVIRSVDGTPLAAGPTSPPEQGVVVAQRIVFLDGDESKLLVRVW